MVWIPLTFQVWGGNTTRPQADCAFGPLPVRGMAFGMQSYPTATACTGKVFLVNVPRGFLLAARAFPIGLFNHQPQSVELERHPTVPIHSLVTESLVGPRLVSIRASRGKPPPFQAWGR